jgi:hypothetical protein
VTLGGKQIYLGPFNSTASRTEYDRVVAEWLASRRRSSVSGTESEESLLVSEMILQYWTFAQKHCQRE